MACMTKESGADRATMNCSKRTAILGPTAWVNMPTVGLKPVQPVEEVNLLVQNQNCKMCPCRSHSLIVV